MWCIFSIGDSCTTVCRWGAGSWYCGYQCCVSSSYMFKHPLEWTCWVRPQCWCANTSHSVVAGDDVINENFPEMRVIANGDAKGPWYHCQMNLFLLWMLAHETHCLQDTKSSSMQNMCALCKSFFVPLSANRLFKTSCKQETENPL